MALKLFGLKRKAESTKAPKAGRLVEFEEIYATAPSAAAPPSTGMPPSKAPRAKSNLSKKQLAQRKYAANMKSVRKRASGAKGGKGRVAKRSGATKLRRELGLKPGKAAGKKAKKGGSKKR